MSEAYSEFVQFDDCPGLWRSHPTLIGNIDGYQIRTNATWTIETTDGREYLAVGYHQNTINNDLYHFVVIWRDDGIDPHTEILHREQHDMNDLESECGSRADAMEEVVTWVAGKAFDVMQRHSAGITAGNRLCQSSPSRDCGENR